MLHLSSYSNNRGGFSYSDVEDFRFPKVEHNRLPRHISSLESPNHKIANSNSLLVSPKSPTQMKTGEAKVSNLAVSILTYQLKDNAARQKHLANLRSNLQHRFEVAKAAQNTQLMTMLQEEFRQLSSI